MAELTNDEANDLADDILLREEFLPARDPGFFARQVERVTDFISNILERIFGAIFGGGGGAAGSTLAVILVSLAVLVLLFAIYKAVTGRVPKDKTEDATARIVFDEVVEPEQLRAELAQHLASENWRAAVIAAFRLGVVGLIDTGVAREVAGATTGDFARAVEHHRPELIGTYNGAARSFDRAFYSDLTIQRDDLDRVQKLLDALTTASAK